MRAYERRPVLCFALPCSLGGCGWPGWYGPSAGPAHPTPLEARPRRHNKGSWTSGRGAWQLGTTSLHTPLATAALQTFQALAEGQGQVGVDGPRLVRQSGSSWYMCTLFFCVCWCNSLVSYRLPFTFFFFFFSLLL